MTAQCEGMGEVGSARYEPALLPPCPSIRALSYSNCQRPPIPAYGPGSLSVKAELSFVRPNTNNQGHFWSFSLSSVFATAEHILMSSANICVIRCVISGKSFMNITMHHKSKGKHQSDMAE